MAGYEEKNFKESHFVNFDDNGNSAVNVSCANVLIVIGFRENVHLKFLHLE